MTTTVRIELVLEAKDGVILEDILAWGRDTLKHSRKIAEERGLERPRATMALPETVMTLKVED